MLFLIVPDPNRGIWNKTKLKLDFWCFTFLYSASYFWQNYNTTMNILYLTEKCFHIYLCFQRVSKSVISSVMCARVKFTALLWAENIPSEYWKNRILLMSLKLREKGDSAIIYSVLGRTWLSLLCVQVSKLQLSCAQRKFRLKIETIEFC